MEPASETEYKAMESQPLSGDALKPSLVRQKTSTEIAVTNVQKWLSPTIVDGCISGGFLAATGMTMHGIDLLSKSAFPLFNGGMLTMAIIFFGGPSPPPIKNFLLCTIGSWALGFGLRFLLMESVSASCLVAGLLLVYFKWQKVFFPPTLGVAVFLISDQTIIPPSTVGVSQNILFALRWLVTPWLAGSIIFYVVALKVAELRTFVRNKLSRAKFSATFADKTDAELIDVFKQYDTSGDGMLQADELTFAWQKVTGEQLTTQEAQELVQTVDTDGNNEIDQDEFIQLIRVAYGGS